jgi:dTMP kinase
MSRRGTFIAFEGLDGSGKSTHIKALCMKLRQKGLDVIKTSEPSRGRIGKFIREYVESREIRLPPEIEALLFAADRLDHVKRIIEPALERGKIVVSDRYTHSSLAYQGAEGLNIEWIEELNKFAIKPELTILLDVPSETALGRMKGRRKTIFEVDTVQQKVRNIYLKIARKGELVKIDANRPFQEVHTNLCSLVNNLLSKISSE